MTRLTDAQTRKDARLYALLHRGSPGDLEFYRSRSEGASRVLELGVGYGRVAIHLASRGFEVSGLDRHAGLLELAREEARSLGLESKLELTLGDMRDFELAHRYDRILIPHSGLYCLLQPREVESCLSCCRRHLAPEGRLLLDVYRADAFHLYADPDAEDDSGEPLVEVHDGSERLTVYERSRWDRPRQHLDVSYAYYDSRGRLVHESRIEQRYMLAGELERQLSSCGFSCRGVWGGFDGTAPSEQADAIVIEAVLG